jgi:hypothetical protein
MLERRGCAGRRRGCLVSRLSLYLSLQQVTSQSSPEPNSPKPTQPPHLGTSAHGIVSAAPALVTIEVRCMIRRNLVRPTSRTESPRASRGEGSSGAALTWGGGEWE